MIPHEVAARFDNRPGYALVDYGEVGLPLFLINAVSIVQEAKNLHPIEEFILRCTKLELSAIEEIAGFLGLGVEIINRTLVSMIQDDLVTIERNDQDLQRVCILPKGVIALSDAGLIRPEERTLSFAFDGLTRKPKYVEQNLLLFPRELRETGLPEIPALPGRGPDVTELNALEVEDVVHLASRGGRRTGKILRIKSIESRNRCFLPAVALVFRSHIGDDFRVLFAIGGRLSEEHERAFATADGLKRSQRFAGLKSSARPELRQLVGEEIASSLPREQFDRHLTPSLAQARVEVAATLRKVDQAKSDEQKFAAEGEVREARAKLGSIEENIGKHLVRPLPVYEHAEIFANAFADGTKRLLLISPWVRRAVVKRDLIKQIEKLLGDGATIHIGYGIDDIDAAASRADREAVKDLERLAKNYPKFVFKRLGDTHAKVLIKNSEYFVVTSFNWLSFRGDPNRTFREEWGTLVAVPHQVDEFYDRLLVRFA